MKYILMMTGKKSDFEGYARWSKEELQANVSFMRAFSKELKDSGVFVSTEAWDGPVRPSSSELEKTENRSPTAYFRNRRSFWPDTGLSMWRARSRLIRLPREPHKRRALAENLKTCPSKCGPF